MTSRTIASLAAVAGVALLAACGGGGGSGPTTEVAPTPAPDPTPPVPARQAHSFRERLAASPDRIDFRDAARYFGSAAVFTPPRPTDIETAFDGRRATVTLERGTRGDIRLDTDRAWFDDGGGASLLGLPGRMSRIRYTYGADSAGQTLALIAVDRSNGDPADYLAGGYWLRYEPASVPSVQIGAFVDGPELDLAAPATLPVAGTASYRGRAAGLYAAEYGTDATVPPGSGEIGEFSGSADLTADFGAGTIRGCVGCSDRIRLTGVSIDSATGEVDSFGVVSDYRLEFGATPLDRGNATFQGTDVTLSHPDIQVVSTGHWAGQLSNRPDAAGDPRAVAGAFGGQATTAGGSRAVFVGAFAAGKR